MNTRAPAWKHTELVACFLVKRRKDTEQQLLLGYKLTGVVANLVMPPGGHIERDDLDPITASQRETFEEVNLRPKIGKKVAELRVRLDDAHQKIMVHIILFTEWTGRLKNKTKEFKWLKFIKFSEIPWGLMPPGERSWFEEVLIKNKRRLVHIHCGKNRKDVISVRSRPFH